MLESLVNQASRQALTETILAAKKEKRLSWEAIAEGCDCSREFVTAAMLGQHPLPDADARLVGARLGLDAAQIETLKAIPVRGSFADGLPTDPTIYRFYEMIQVYGTTLKSLVHEDFGDGIISAINFKLRIEKKHDPDGGERCVITLDGKFLPFKPY